MEACVLKEGQAWPVAGRPGVVGLHRPAASSEEQACIRTREYASKSAREGYGSVCEARLRYGQRNNGTME